MTSEVYRWQAAMGALAGALVADALAHETDQWPEDICAAIAIAESLLDGQPLPLDLSPIRAVPAAVHLAVGPSPLLADPATVELIDRVRASLDGAAAAQPTDERLAQADHLATESGFNEAVQHAITTGIPGLPLLTGALVGLRGGVGAVPARPVSQLRAPHGRPGRRHLSSLTNRLLGIDRPLWYDPRNRRGPREVLPGLWLSNLLGVRSFLNDHPDGVVLSLCDDEGRAGDHPDHITFHLEDGPGTDANPSLQMVVEDVLSEIAAARDAAQPVLLHCRHGASRTGLILRLILVKELALNAEDALIEAQCLWSHTSSWNRGWGRLVEEAADARQRELPSA